MIYVHSFLDVADNSGARIGQCIRILTPVSLFFRGSATIADLILLALKKVIPLKKMKKGGIYRGLIVRVRKSVKRVVGYLTFFKSAVILFTKKDEPIGSRISGLIGKEVRERQQSKISNLALGLL